MKLSDLLRKPTDFRPIALAAFNPLSTAARRILNRWPSMVVDPPEHDREKLVQALRRRYDNKDWSDTPMSFVTSAAVALYDENRRARPNLAALRDFYCSEVACSDRTTFLNAMLGVYIGSYVPGAPHTIELANALRRTKDRIGGRWATLLKSFPACLDPHEAHTVLASRMLEMASPWNELRLLGIPAPHAPGLMDHAHQSFVDYVSPTLNERHTIDRLLIWLQPEGQQARVSGAAEALAALLAPWEQQIPHEDVKLHLIRKLTTMYGDPRVRGENAVWLGVPTPRRAVIERWLTGENIRFFLDVVSAVETSHMWAPRRKFWLGLHEQKRIAAAWVAFSRAGVEHARASAGNEEFLRFGRQMAGGTREKTSLLILRIGNKIVIEGSHNYKVHVFRYDHPQAPKLYEQHYDCEVIRLISGSWSVSHNGDWQGRVLEQI